MSFTDFLHSISKEPISVINTQIAVADYVPIDISIFNKALNGIDITDAATFENYIDTYLTNNNAKVAYGGYLEKRTIYNRSENFNQNRAETDRNIHLGIDLWCNAGTAILAVLDGEIHSFKNNAQVADYGPTIILKHIIKEVEFYSLYGHLSVVSLENLEVGQQVKKGQVIGALGTAKVNGDYAPHLHFQLIKDMQGNFGDYPGVSSKTDLDFYKNNCPDPNLLLKLD